MGDAEQDSQCQLRVRKLSWQTQENLGQLRIHVLPTCSASPGIATHVGHVVWVLLAMFRVAHIFITVSFDCYLRRKSWNMVTVLWLLERAGSWGVQTLSSWQAGSGERSRGWDLPALALARRMLWDLMQNRGSMETGMVLTISQWAKRPSSSLVQPSHHICFNPFSKVWAMPFYLKIYKTKIRKYISSYHVIDLGSIHPHILNIAYLIDGLKHFHIVEFPWLICIFRPYFWFLGFK